MLVAAGQPLPRVLPACVFAAFDDPLVARVFPAFESAPLLGLPLLFTMLLTSPRHPLQPGLPVSTDSVLSMKPGEAPLAVRPHTLPPMAQDDDEPEYVTERMNVTRRKDSRYSQSRKKPGEFSPLTRSDEDELGQVTLSPIVEDDETSEPQVIYVYDEPEPPRSSKEQEEWDAFVQQVVRELLTVAVVYGAPIAKRLWIEKFRPAIQARTERRGARRALRRQRRADKKNAATEASLVEPTADVASVAQEFKTNMTSSEAQARYLVALAAQRFADEQMQLIAEADIRVGEGFQELEHALSELPPEQVANMLRRFEAEPALLAGDALTGLGLILGVERNGGPLPLEAPRRS